MTVAGRLTPRYLLVWLSVDNESGKDTSVRLYQSTNRKLLERLADRLEAREERHVEFTGGYLGSSYVLDTLGARSFGNLFELEQQLDDEEENSNT